MLEPEEEYELTDLEDEAMTDFEEATDDEDDEDPEYMQSQGTFSSISVVLSFYKFLFSTTILVKIYFSDDFLASTLKIFFLFWICMFQKYFFNSFHVYF